MSTCLGEMTAGSGCLIILIGEEEKILGMWKSDPISVPSPESGEGYQQGGKGFIAFHHSLSGTLQRSGTWNKVEPRTKWNPGAQRNPRSEAEVGSSEAEVGRSVAEGGRNVVQGAEAAAEWDKAHQTPARTSFVGI